MGNRTGQLARSFGPHLRAWGYRGPLLRPNFRFGQAGSDRQVALAAFAQEPADARTACIAVIEVKDDAESEVKACRDLGAPVVFACHDTGVEWWKQSPQAPTRLQQVPAHQVDTFLREHHTTFAPRDVYRAKTQSRLDPQLRLPFVDELLMPHVERAIGERLGGVIDEVFVTLKREAGQNRLTDQLSHQLLQDTFWLLAAKILQDKGVTAFETLDLQNIGDVFRRVGQHYGEATQLLHRQHPVPRPVLKRAATRIAQLSHLGQVTTESLAYIYENTLVTPELRKALGIHSTPQYLVDYVVGRLEPLIKNMEPENRHVFEPACGHGAFLVAAMRHLRDLLPTRRDAHSYLQKHLRGLEIDPIARELARLSLTLSDIPNPDGWQLSSGDMFAGETLRRFAERTTILLANPPFEDFSVQDRVHYERMGSPLTYVNRVEEMLHRTLPYLPQQAVFGLIVPQNILSGRSSRRLREILLRDFALHEITLLPDKVFAFADVEAAVLIGQKEIATKQSIIRYRRVREREMDAFRETYRARSDRQILQFASTQPPNYELRLPDHAEIWIRGSGRTLKEMAHVGQGFTYRNQDLTEGARTWSKKSFPGAVRGYAHIGEELKLHGRPDEVWMSLDKKVVLRPRSGTVTGQAQVLMNHHPVSRGPWRIKAVIDREGHAVSGRFLVVRPQTPENIPVEVLWALCNSPYANAYAYTHGTKRHIEAGTMREMPVPRLTASTIQQLVRKVREYIDAASEADEAVLRGPGDDEKCQSLLIAIDALILRGYDLPARLERRLLSIYDEADGKRAGVPFRWPPYYPRDRKLSLPLYVYLSARHRGMRFDHGWSTRPAEHPASEWPSNEDGLQGEHSEPLDPGELEEEMLYEELASLDAFREQVGTTPELEERAESQFKRLRRLQEEQASQLVADFRERFLMPPEEGPDLLDRVARLLERHGDSSSPDTAISTADRENT